MNRKGKLGAKDDNKHLSVISLQWFLLPGDDHAGPAVDQGGGRGLHEGS